MLERDNLEGILQELENLKVVDSLALGRILQEEEIHQVVGSLQEVERIQQEVDKHQEEIRQEEVLLQEVGILEVQGEEMTLIIYERG